MISSELDARKAEWRKQLETQTARVLESLSELLPPDRAKSKQVSILAARAQRILSHEINNTLANAELEVMRNQLLNDLLIFIQYLVPEDFGEEAAKSVHYKDGHLMYQIPDRMQQGQRYECRVRIARQLDQLLKDLPSKEFIHTEEIPVAQVMEVEIIDPSGTDNPAFNLLLLSDGEQVVEELDYTEWLFLIRPLLAGEHLLYIRVSVLFEINGKERKKNVLVNRQIEVITEMPEPTPTQPAFTQVFAEQSVGGATRQVEDKSRVPSPTEIGGGPGFPGFDQLNKEIREQAENSPPAPIPAPIPVEEKRSKPPWAFILGVMLIGSIGVFLLDRSFSDDQNLFPEGYTPTQAPEVETVTEYCLVCEELGVVEGEKPLRRSRLVLTRCSDEEEVADLGEVPNCCLDLSSQQQRAADWQNGVAHIYELWPGPIVTKQRSEVKPEDSDLSNSRDTIY
ncbi:MAG: hypothetical protein AAGF87_08495 [Bacteroidota bacterium]